MVSVLNIGVAALSLGGCSSRLPGSEGTRPGGLMGCGNFPTGTHTGWVWAKIRKFFRSVLIFWGANKANLSACATQQCTGWNAQRQLNANVRCKGRQSQLWIQGCLRLSDSSNRNGALPYKTLTAGQRGSALRLWHEHSLRVEALTRLGKASVVFQAAAALRGWCYFLKIAFLRSLLLNACVGVSGGGNVAGKSDVCIFFWWKNIVHGEGHGHACNSAEQLAAWLADLPRWSLFMGKWILGLLWASNLAVVIK